MMAKRAKPSEVYVSSTSSYNSHRSSGSSTSSYPRSPFSHTLRPGDAHSTPPTSASSSFHSARKPQLQQQLHQQVEDDENIGQAHSTDHACLVEQSTCSAEEPVCSIDNPCSLDHACSLDLDDFFAKFFQHDSGLELGLDFVSDDVPAPGAISNKADGGIGDTLIYDAGGNARPFKSFYSGPTAVGERQLIIFVRHFYCGACQAYVRALTESITPSVYFTMPIPTSIVVIGCGSPELIPHYKAVTGTPYPVFADPSRRVFRGLGMSWTLDMGSKRPGYMKDTSRPAWLAGQVKQMARSDRSRWLKGGNLFQIGGEFLFTEGEVMWCHRMKNYRDHTEIETLRKVLEIE